MSSAPADKLLQDLARLDFMTYQHSVAVAEHMNHTALAMGLDHEQAKEAELLGAIHELGKLKSPPELFKKLQGGQALNNTERQQLAQPSEMIIEILGKDQLPARVREAIAHMGARYDGKGTPATAGEAIPLLARLLKVCDLFDLLCRRRHGVAISPQKAQEALKNNAGILFDPIVVQVFCERLSSST